MATLKSTATPHQAGVARFIQLIKAVEKAITPDNVGVDRIRAQRLVHDALASVADRDGFEHALVEYLASNFEGGPPETADLAEYFESGGPTPADLAAGPVADESLPTKAEPPPLRDYGASCAKEWLAQQESVLAMFCNELSTPPTSSATASALTSASRPRSRMRWTIS